METISTKVEKKEYGSNMHKVVNECNKSCIECLGCSYNKNSQFNLILLGLFNGWKDIDAIKWRDVNQSCSLK